MKETDEMFDEIWTFVEEKLKTPVPPYFKYILKSCGYDNGLSIATIDDDDIQHFVNEVKNGNVSKYFEASGETDVLEGSTKNTDDFEFSRGHLKFLKAIVVFVKKYAEDNGPDSFTVANKKKPTKTQKAQVANGRQKKMKYVHSNSDMRSAQEIPSEMEKDIEKHRQILCKKLVTTLKSLTKKLYNINRADIEKKIQNNQLVSVEIKQSEQQNSENSTQGSTKSEISFKFTASSFCPYCSKKVNVFWVSNMKWNSSNFDRHLSLVHPKTSSDSEEGTREVTTDEIPVAAVNTATNDKQRYTIEIENTTGETQTDLLSDVIEIGFNKTDKPLGLINTSNEPRKATEQNPSSSSAIETSVKRGVKASGTIQVATMKTDLTATNGNQCYTIEMVEATSAIAKTSSVIAACAFKTNPIVASDANKNIKIDDPIDEIITGSKPTDSDEMEVISLSDDDVEGPVEGPFHSKNIVAYSDTDSDSSVQKQEEANDLPKKYSDKRSETTPITTSSRLPIRRQFATSKTVNKTDLKKREENWKKYF
ncbi:uncharacterized protein LOC119073849 [Bradysia coprophila]|uniref:uncharacterized protein LOC119073849 n=1 Tax=Bradysia coprophila TaxID=38358 RepID=UPI00187DC6A9|nr:uncharacterized protein LOC119073849 [Bradysia coprophila]